MVNRSCQIPFNKPYFTGNEFHYIKEAIENNLRISGDGLFTKRCHAFFEKELGIPKALLTTSCTDALEMAALLLNIEPGDEVIVPSFTFVSTVNAFVLRGAKPVFIDIRPDTLNLDENKLEDLITPKTKAIVSIHYAGVGCEMDAIMHIAGSQGIPVVEDNAHGLFAKYRGRYLGTFGTLSAQSFHETKNLSCGEGGALFINDQVYVNRAEIIREKGTNRSQFFRGEVDKYTWVDIGSSYLPSDILAAFLYAQIENYKHIQEKRKNIFNFYYDALKDLERAEKLRLPVIPSHCDISYHLFYILLPSEKKRDALMSKLKEEGILAVFHYLPLHVSPMGVRLGYQQGDLPVTEDVSSRLLRLPFYNDLKKKELDTIVSMVKKYV